MDLAEKRCIPCEGNIAPFSREEAEKYIARVKGWSLADGQIVKEFKFKDFREALGFVNRLGDLAESEGHHPDILLYDYNHVRVSLSTHAIGGLHENDFILAAKIDRISER